MELSLEEAMDIILELIACTVAVALLNMTVFSGHLLPLLERVV